MPWKFGFPLKNLKKFCKFSLTPLPPPYPSPYYIIPPLFSIPPLIKKKKKSNPPFFGQFWAMWTMWMSIILQIWNNFGVISLQVLTKKKQTLEGHIKIHGPQPSFPNPRHQKVTANLKILVKIFSLKQKTNEILPAALQKINFVSSRKQPYVP